jgi:hypothetical protein
MAYDFDDLRKEVKDSIDDCRKNGYQPVVLKLGLAQRDVLFSNINMSKQPSFQGVPIEFVNDVDELVVTGKLPILSNIEIDELLENSICECDDDKDDGDTVCVFEDMDDCSETVEHVKQAASVGTVDDSLRKILCAFSIALKCASSDFKVVAELCSKK